MKLKRRTRKQLPKMIALSAAVMAAMGGFGYMAHDTALRPVADEHGCFDGVIGGNTVVFADVSPPRWNGEQGGSLRSRLNQLYDSLAFNEKFTLFTTEGDLIGDVLKPRLHLCGQASSSEELESVGAAPAQAGYLKRQKQRLYARKLAPELDTLLSENPDESRQQNYQSPILEQFVALSRRPELRAGTKLVIISDMIQNSESAHFCTVKGDMPPFAIFRKRQVYLERLQPESLEGIEVEVLMLQRYGYGMKGALPYCRDEEEIKTFYRDYFHAAGVKKMRFVRIRQGRS